MHLFSFRFSTSLIYFALSLNAGSLSGDIFLNTFLLGAVEVPETLFNVYVLHSGLLGELHKRRLREENSFTSSFQHKRPLDVLLIAPGLFEKRHKTLMILCLRQKNHELFQHDVSWNRQFCQHPSHSARK